MKRIFWATAPCLLGCCWAPAFADVPRPGPDTSSQAPAASADLKAYGGWMARLNQAEKPLLDGFAGLGLSWDRAMAPHDPARAEVMFRPEMARFKRLVIEVNRSIAAIAPPTITVLHLPADVDPTALASALIKLNGQIDSVVDGYGPLLIAMRHNNMAEVQAAVRNLFRGVGLMMDSRVLMTKAKAAVEPADHSTHDLTMIQLTFYQAVSRLVRGLTIGAAHTDPAMANDLEALATQADHFADEGMQRSIAEAALLQQRGDAARARGDGNAAALADRVIAIYRVDAAGFPLGHQMAGILRQEAASARKLPMTMERASGYVTQLKPIRDGFMAIVANESAAAGGPAQ